jgi:hypothetical protein
MYFFFHLLTGIILGLLIGDILRDKRWTIPCAIGAVLPDLIDKPLGLLLFGDSIGSGRVFMHTLLAALVLLIPGLVIWQWKKNPVVPGIAVGVISHQVLDLMWRTPKTWFYPLYGGFSRPTHVSDIITLLESEIKNPLEIFLFICLCAGIGAFIFHHRIAAVLARHPVTVRGLLACGACGLCILTGIFLWLSRGKHTLSYLSWTRPEQFILGGIIAAMAALLCWRWYRKVDGKNSFR